jgi:hypothetical protein
MKQAVSIGEVWKQDFYGIQEHKIVVILDSYEENHLRILETLVLEDTLFLEKNGDIQCFFEFTLLQTSNWKKIA